jgi:hypothetical protein
MPMQDIFIELDFQAHWPHMKMMSNISNDHVLNSLWKPCEGCNCSQNIFANYNNDKNKCLNIRTMGY